MRSLSLAVAAAVCAVALTQIASAADIATKAPVYKTPVAVAPSWTGLYVGGGVGYGMYNADTIWSLPTGALQPLTQTQGGRGWLGTVTVGYDYQFNNNIVAGVLADYDLASIKGTIQDQGPFTVGTMTENSAWAIGARAGWLVTPQILPYVNAGYTQAHLSSVNMVSNNGTSVGTLVSTIPSQSYSGWFLGGGVEANVAPGWFWRNEYRYASYGSKTLADTCANPTFCAAIAAVPVPPDLVSIRPYVQTVRSELVYKFNSGGPANAYSPPTPAPVLSWTGLYVGGGVDYGMYNADTIWSLPTGALQPLTQTQGGRGWLGTVTVGYDYQFNNNIVAGVLADYDLASIKGTIQDQGPFTVGTMTENSAWAIGARAGWLVTPQILPYVNAGYTQAHFSSVNMVSNNTNGALFGAGAQPPVGTLVSTIPSQTYSGWFLGGGMETKLPWFGDGWFTRTEYRYASYGSKTLPDTCAILAFCGPGPLVDLVSIHPYVQTVRSEIVYKFNSGR